MNSNVKSNIKPDYDQPIKDIAEYVTHYVVENDQAYNISRYCFMETLGCGLLALSYPECAKHLGSIVIGTYVPNGAKVPGTQFEMDPVKAAFDMGCMNHWLNFNGARLTDGCVHLSDNIAGVLAVADYVSRQRVASGYHPFVMKDVLTAIIKAYEIQGVMALEESFKCTGLDDFVLVKLASTAVITQMLGGELEEVMIAVSQVLIDASNQLCHHQIVTNHSRQSWGVGNIVSRAVQLALMTMSGESGYPDVLSNKTWGIYEVLCHGKTFEFQRNYAELIINTVDFKQNFCTDKVEIDSVNSDKLSQEKGISILQNKFSDHVKTRFPEKHANEIINIFHDKNEFENLPVNELMDLLVI